MGTRTGIRGRDFSPKRTGAVCGTLGIDIGDSRPEPARSECAHAKGNAVLGCQCEKSGEGEPSMEAVDGERSGDGDCAQ